MNKKMYIGSDEKPENPYPDPSMNHKVFSNGVLARDAQMQEVDVGKLAEFICKWIPVIKPPVNQVESAINQFVESQK